MLLSNIGRFDVQRLFPRVLGLQGLFAEISYVALIIDACIDSDWARFNPVTVNAIVKAMERIIAAESQKVYIASANVPTESRPLITNRHGCAHRPFKRSKP